MAHASVISSSESTSRSLVERVRRREPEAWQRFASLYGPVVFRWSMGAGLQPHDAADVMQDVFQAVTQNIDRFERRSADDSLRGWLWTLTRNKIRDHFRRSQAEPPALGGTSAHQQLQQSPDMAEGDAGPLEATTAELSHRALTLIQNEFETSTWQAFLATAVEDRPAADVAMDLGLSVAAVYKAKSRVLLRLRRELDGLLD